MPDAGGFATRSALQPAAPAKETGGQVNLAPVEPLANVRSDPRYWERSSLVQFVQEMMESVVSQHIEERRQIIEMGRLMSNLRSGKLDLKRDPVAGNLALIKPLPGRPRSGLHIYPLAQVNSSQLTSIWTLSRPRAVPRHFGDNNKAQIQHALLERVMIHYDADLFDELFHQNWSLSMMDYGTSCIRLYYDRDKNPSIFFCQSSRTASEASFQATRTARSAFTTRPIRTRSPRARLQAASRNAPSATATTSATLSRSSLPSTPRSPVMKRSRREISVRL
jgi:hypothetical protein